MGPEHIEDGTPLLGRLLHTGSVFKEYVGQLQVPVLSTSLNCLGEHLDQCSVEALHQAIPLGVVGRSIDFMHPHDLTDLLQQG